MAGEGRRFLEKGYSVPKPFIKINGKCMADLAIKCYHKNTPINRHYYIFRPEHENYFKRKYKEYYLMPLKTRGPLETIMSQHEVLEKIATRESLIIADCDSFIKKSELFFIIQFFKKNRASGGTPIRRSLNPGYSYAKVEKNRILETREKDPFTNWSTTGPYWFRHGYEFVESASRTLEKGIFTISPVYNDYISRNKKVLCYPTETFNHIGTPEELNQYVEHCGITL